MWSGEASGEGELGTQHFPGQDTQVGELCARLVSGTRGLPRVGRGAAAHCFLLTGLSQMERELLKLAACIGLSFSSG